MGTGGREGLRRAHQRTATPFGLLAHPVYSEFLEELEMISKVILCHGQARGVEG